MHPNLAVQWQAASLTSCSAVSEVFAGSSGILMMATGQIPPEPKWFFSSLSISLFEKLDPFLLDIP